MFKLCRDSEGKEMLHGPLFLALLLFFYELLHTWVFGTFSCHIPLSTLHVSFGLQSCYLQECTQYVLSVLGERLGWV